MNEQTLKLLEQLANKLGTTSEYLWHILIRQAYINATLDLVWVILTVISAYFSFRFSVRIWKKAREEGSSIFSDRDEYAISSIMVSILSVIFICVALFSLYDGIICLLNPEYWALQQILGAINNK